jgi:hypothetical protein
MSEKDRLLQQLNKSKQAYDAARERERYVEKMIASYRSRRQQAFLQLERDARACEHAGFDLRPEPSQLKGRLSCSVF